MSQVRTYAATTSAVIAGFLLLAIPCISTAGVTGWRGDGTGRYATATPPTTWSDAENVLWRTTLPATSGATPVPTGGRVFVTAEPSTLICVDADTGAILWQRSATYEDLAPEQAEQVRADQARAAELQERLASVNGEIRKLKVALQDSPDDPQLQVRLAQAETSGGAINAELEPLLAAWHMPPATHPTNGYSSATPVTDGERVYVVFGTGVVAAYDFTGARLWGRILEKPTHPWGHSASPLLVGERLIVHILNVSALNPDTGEVIWQTRAPEAWGTPVATRVGEADVIITPSGSLLRANDGALLASGVSALDYCAPIVENTVTYFVQNGGKAVQLPDALTGDTVAITELWTTTPRKDRYYASPVLHDGLIYACTQANILSVIDAKTGAVVHERALDLGRGTCYPSVTLAGGRVFVSSDTGRTAVLEPGREPRQIALNMLEPFRASPVFAGDRLYIRGLENLYCIRASGQPSSERATLGAERHEESH